MENMKPHVFHDVKKRNKKYIQKGNKKRENVFIKTRGEETKQITLDRGE